MNIKKKLNLYYNTLFFPTSQYFSYYHLKSDQQAMEEDQQCKLEETWWREHPKHLVRTSRTCSKSRY
jgi:hypothetical protein